MRNAAMRVWLCGVLLGAGAACGRANPLGSGADLRDPAKGGADGGGGGGGKTGGTSGGGSGGAGAGAGSGAGGSAGSGTAGGASVAGQPFGGGSTAGTGEMMCDADVCMYPDGTVCYADGSCCYPDGSCSGVAVPVAGAGVPPGVFPPGFFPPGFFPMTGPPPITEDPWQSPIEDLGDDGWRDSTDPLCTGEQGYVSAHSVWSDARGVFALVSAEGGGDYYFEDPANGSFGGFPGFMGGPFPYPRGSKCIGEGCPHQVLYRNDGSGWKVFYESTEGSYLYSGNMRLTGVPDGPLFMYGYAEEAGGPCGLATISASGERTCEPVYAVEDVFVVNSSLAYGVLEGDLIRYDGTDWGPLTTPLPSVDDMSRVWATPERAFATGYNAGKIYRIENSGLTVEDTRTLEMFTALWGFGADDVYAGTQSGRVYHFDGASWSPIETPEPASCPYEGGVMGMWGSEGVVYYHSGNRLVKVTGGKGEVIAEWGCPAYEQVPYITSLWGSGPNEVFIALVDDRVPRQECGTTFLLRYDGSEFHRF